MGKPEVTLYALVIKFFQKFYKKQDIKHKNKETKANAHSHLPHAR